MQIKILVALGAVFLYSLSLTYAYKSGRNSVVAKQQEVVIKTQKIQAEKVVEYETIYVPKIQVKYEKQIQYVEKVVDRCLDTDMPDDIVQLFDCPVCESTAGSSTDAGVREAITRRDDV